MSEESNFELNLKKACQDRIKAGTYSYAGYLKKKCNLVNAEQTWEKNKVTANVPNFIKKVKYVPFLQRYVILDGGVFYIYKDDTSKSALSSSFHLAGYNKLEKIPAGKKRGLCGFMLLHSSEANKLKEFMVSNDRDRKQWMVHIRNEISGTIGRRNTKIVPKQSDCSDVFYSDIEETIYDSMEAKSLLGVQYNHPENSDGEDDEKDYEYMSDTEEIEPELPDIVKRHPMPKPRATPSPDKKKPALPPKKAPQSKSIPQSSESDDVFYDDTSLTAIAVDHTSQSKPEHNNNSIDSSHHAADSDSTNNAKKGWKPPGAIPVLQGLKMEKNPPKRINSEDSSVPSQSNSTEKIKLKSESCSESLNVDVSIPPRPVPSCQTCTG